MTIIFNTSILINNDRNNKFSILVHVTTEKEELKIL